MISKSFGLLFYLKKHHGDTNVHRPIYLRITIDGVMKEMSIQRTWDPLRWNLKTSRAIVGKPSARRTTANKMPQPLTPDDEAQALNAYLDTVQAKVHEARHQLIMGGKPVTAEAVRNIVQGRETSGERPHTLLEIFQHHNDQVKALVGKEYSKGTLTKFNTVFNHTRTFLQWKYKTDDIDIRKLDYEFIADLEVWYKSQQRIDHNTTMKYIACIKKMTLRALRNRWLQRDPFMGFNMALREVEREEGLTNEELEQMAAKTFPSERMSQVRDIFLFSCYTGLAYADLQKLKRSEISTGIDGGKWIFTRRQKTDTASRIPLLPLAQEILERYTDHPRCREKDRALPILSNQKMNGYLKEIGDCCSITKHLTCHIARHTFATTITLSNGVPIETVSKMLGHRNLKTTQHYAKILDRKVSQDMLALKERLAKKPAPPAERSGNKGADSPFFYDFRYLMNGKSFERTLNAFYADYFLKNIFEIYGSSGLRNAVASLQKHINYYEGHFKTTMHTLRGVLANYTTLLDDSQEEEIEQEAIEVEVVKDTKTKEELLAQIKSLETEKTEVVYIKGVAFKRKNWIIVLIKELRDYRCQICGTRILKKGGGFYIEAAHITAKRHGGDETSDNIVLLCPNHHKEFDLGEVEIMERKADLITLLMNGQKHAIVL